MGASFAHRQVMDQAQEAEGQESETNQQAAVADHVAPEPAGFSWCNSLVANWKDSRAVSNSSAEWKRRDRPGATGAEDDLVEADQITVFGARA